MQRDEAGRPVRLSDGSGPAPAYEQRLVNGGVLAEFGPPQVTAGHSGLDVEPFGEEGEEDSDTIRGNDRSASLRTKVVIGRPTLPAIPLSR